MLVHWCWSMMVLKELWYLQESRCSSISVGTCLLVCYNEVYLSAKKLSPSYSLKTQKTTLNVHWEMFCTCSKHKISPLYLRLLSELFWQNSYRSVRALNVLSTLYRLIIHIFLPDWTRYSERTRQPPPPRSNRGIRDHYLKVSANYELSWNS